MTQPTDKQIAAGIDCAVAALNIILTVAADAGIKTEIGTINVTAFADKYKREIVSVKLTREQEIKP